MEETDTKKWQKKAVIFGSTVFVLAILGIFLPRTSQAHQSGCHRWHSCPSDSGSYTCGDLGYACQYSTYSTDSYSSSPSYSSYDYQYVAGCSVLAKTFDEVNNFNKIYRESLGRDAKCNELESNVSKRTSHSKLRTSLLKTTEGKKYQRKKAIQKKYEGKIISTSASSSNYLVQSGKCRLVTSAEALRSWGVRDGKIFIFSNQDFSLLDRGDSLDNRSELDFTPPTAPKTYYIQNEKRNRYLTNGTFGNKRPLFSWFDATDDIQLDGYILAISLNKDDDPEKLENIYLQGNKWLVPERFFTVKGTYYLLVKSVDVNGNRGPIVFLQYSYDPSVASI